MFFSMAGRAPDRLASDGLFGLMVIGALSLICAVRYFELENLFGGGLASGGPDRTLVYLLAIALVALMVFRNYRKLRQAARDDEVRFAEGAFWLSAIVFAGIGILAGWLFYVGLSELVPFAIMRSGQNVPYLWLTIMVALAASAVVLLGCSWLSRVWGKRIVHAR